MKKSCEDWLTSQFGDDAETIRSLYDEYLLAAEELRVRLAEARQRDDKGEIERVLHTLKGTAGMAGDMTLSQKAQDARATQDPALLDAIANEIVELKGMVSSCS